MTQNEWFNPDPLPPPVVDGPEPQGAHAVAEDPEQHVGEEVPDPWYNDGDGWT